MKKKSVSPFGLILEMLDIPVTTLSYEIHVEQSLISKWKSGDRILKSGTGHFDRIICFFIEENKKLNLNTLEKFFSAIYPNEDTFSDNFLNDSLNRFLSKKDIPVSAKNLYVQAKKSLYSSVFSVFNGNKGRRDAFQMLISSAQELENQGEIYIVEREQFTWLLNDKEYMNEWINQILSLLNKGLKVNLVYIISHNFDNVSGFIIACQSIIFNSNFTQYFYYCSNDTDVVYTQYLLKDNMSIMGFTQGDLDMYTSVYTDILTIKCHEHAIKMIMEKSKAPFIAKNAKELQIIFDNIKTFEKRNEVIYFSNSISDLLTLSKELLSEILEYNNISEKDKDKCFRLYEMFQSSVANIGCISRYICAPEDLKECVNKKYFNCYILEKIINKPVKVTNGQFRKHLKNTAELLIDNPNFNVILSSQFANVIADGTTCWCKEGFWELSFDRREKLGIRYCEEYFMVNTLAHLFNDCYNKTPDKYKDNRYVADFLMGL